MNLLKINPQSFHYYKITPTHSLLSSPKTLSKTPNSSLLHYEFFSSSSSVCSYSQISFSFRNPKTNVSNSKGSMWGSEVESFDLFRDYDDLATDGTVYNKTLRLVECSMFAAVAGLAYFLSNSLAIENYFGCFFALPIVISSMRWGLSAGRKTMVATAMLLLTLSGPVKALTYLLMHGLVGLAMGSLWRLGANWGLSIAACTVVLPVFLSLSSSTLFVTRFPFIVCVHLMCGICLMYTCTGSSTRCNRVCCIILIPNKRKYSCSDHNKHSCFSYLPAYSHRCKYSSIDECNICYFWDTAFTQLWILCILAAYSLCCIFH